MIKLDLDDYSDFRMNKKVDEIKKFGVFREIKVFSSPSLDGYHIEIKCFHKLKRIVEFRYRYDFDDDLRRLVLDMLSDDSYTRNVLFDYKVKHKMGVTMRFDRKLMFIWCRISPNDEWKCQTKQKKNIPICTVVQSVLSAQFQL